MDDHCNSGELVDGILSEVQLGRIEVIRNMIADPDSRTDENLAVLREAVYKMKTINSPEDLLPKDEKPGFFAMFDAIRAISLLPEVLDVDEFLYQTLLKLDSVRVSAMEELNMDLEDMRLDQFWCSSGLISLEREILDFFPEVTQDTDWLQRLNEFLYKPNGEPIPHSKYIKQSVVKCMEAIKKAAEA